MTSPLDTGRAAAVYHRLLGYVTRYWKVLAAAIAAMACYAATDTGFAALMKPMLDGSFVDKDPDVIKWVPVLLVLLFLVRGISGFASSYGMTWVGRRIIKDLRGRMFNHLLHLPTRFYDHTTSGKLLAKLTYDVEQVAQASTHAITILVRDTLTILGLLAWMFYLNWQLAAIFLLIGPPIALLVSYINQRFRRISNRIQTSVGDVTHAAEQAIAGQRVIKTFNSQGYEEQRFDQVNESNRHQHMKMAAASAASVPVIQFIAAFALAGVIFIATLEPMLEAITVGTFMSFVVAMMMLLPPIKRLTTVNAAVQKGIVAASSVFTLMDSEAERDTGTCSIDRARGAIAYHHVSFSYDDDTGPAVTDVSFEVEPGHKVAIVGRSGSGKSTLVSLLPRFYDPHSGHITLDGYDLRTLKLDNLREQIAWVGQDVMLFNDTIARNIAYGCRREVSERDLSEAAEAAHAMEFIHKLPRGMETHVGEKGVLLSGGQRQRLAIARALIKDAPILILDEATSSLDTQSEQHIQAALDALMRNRTTLVIAHRLSTIEQADTIIVLDRGSIVETGTHYSLLSRDGHYANLYRLQFHQAPQPGMEQQREGAG